MRVHLSIRTHVREVGGRGFEHGVEHSLEALRSEDGEGRGGHVHRSRTEQPEESEAVIAVEMTDVDATQLRQRQRRALDLVLRCLAAIEQIPGRAVAERQAGHVSLAGRRPGRGAEEGQFHLDISR